MKQFYVNHEEITLFTLEEVADELGISYRTIRRYVAEGRIPACELGRNKYIWMRHLGEYLKGAKSATKFQKVKPPHFDTEVYSPKPWERS